MLYLYKTLILQFQTVYKHFHCVSIMGGGGYHETEDSEKEICCFMRQVHFMTAVQTARQVFHGITAREVLHR